MRRFWQSRNIVAQALWPLSQIYMLGAALDRWLATAQKPSVPVIAIGNVTAGGAGKTPTTIALAKLLGDQTPHILTRGYGANITAPIRVNPAQHLAEQVGDEALLLAAAAPAWAFRRRSASAEAAIAAGAKLLLCDDALQHHPLHRDINLLVLDGEYGVGNGWCLPAGPLREPLHQALLRCHAVILIGEDRHQLTAPVSLPVFHARIMPAEDTAWLKNTRLLAFAGIARPKKFYDFLRAQGAEIVATQDFPDHHSFAEKELERLAAPGLPLVTTEKDWVRLRPLWRQRVRAVPVQLQFDAPEKLREWILHALSR